MIRRWGKRERGSREKNRGEMSEKVNWKSEERKQNQKVRGKYLIGEVRKQVEFKNGEIKQSKQQRVE